jgi:hypothetical protein
MSAVFFRARITIRIFYNEILVDDIIDDVILQIIFSIYPIYHSMGNPNIYADSINDCMFY